MVAPHETREDFMAALEGLRECCIICSVPFGEPHSGDPDNGKSEHLVPSAPASSPKHPGTGQPEHSRPSEHVDAGKAEYPIKLPCSHVIGNECIMRWVSSKPQGRGRNTCPLCRAELFVRPPDENEVESEDDDPEDNDQEYEAGNDEEDDDEESTGSVTTEDSFGSLKGEERDEEENQFLSRLGNGWYYRSERRESGMPCPLSDDETLPYDEPETRAQDLRYRARLVRKRRRDGEEDEQYGTYAWLGNNVRMRRRRVYPRH